MIPTIVSLLIVLPLITFMPSEACRGIYYDGHPEAPLDVCGVAYNDKNGDFSQIYKCFNATVVIEELYTGKECTGILASSWFVYDEDNRYTFDCYNAILCDYAMVRSYLDIKCSNIGSFSSIPVVVNECSYDAVDNISMMYKCSKSAVTEYIYNTSDCSGDVFSTEIIYQNGDCSEDLNNYYEIAQCGDYHIDHDHANIMTMSYTLFIILSLFQIIIY